MIEEIDKLIRKRTTYGQRQVIEPDTDIIMLMIPKGIIDGKNLEELEDELRDFLQEWGISEFSIYNTATGNTTKPKDKSISQRLN